MYSLYAPMWDSNETLYKLLREVLGYTNEEIAIMEKEYFDRNVVVNLTLEKAKEITQIFGDNGFDLYLKDEYNETIGWKYLGIYIAENSPKDHYCDEPLVSREHLADLSKPKPQAPPCTGILFNNQPVVTCPYCQSTNTQKISTMSRAFSVGLFGFGSSKVGKQWHCNKCGSNF